MLSREPRPAPSLEEQDEIISRIIKNSLLKAGDVWCLISVPWFENWKMHVRKWNYQLPLYASPGYIDNRRLLNERGELLPNLIEHLDYHLIPFEAWRFLVNWYGGGPIIRRPVISHTGESYFVLVYTQFLNIFSCDESTGEPEIGSPKFRECLSDTKRKKFKTLNDIIAQYRYLHRGKVFNAYDNDKKMDVDEYRIWIFRDKWLVLDEPLTTQISMFGEKYDLNVMVERRLKGTRWIRDAPLEEWKNTIKQGDLVDALDTICEWYESTVMQSAVNSVLIHFNGWKDKWNEWIPLDSSRLAPVHAYTTGPYVPQTAEISRRIAYSDHVLGKPLQIGVCGIKNLGNTCFMNSILQCLAATESQVNYWIRDDYKKEINVQNVLGWKGKIAEAYGDLLKHIWSGKYTVISPRKLKQVLGEFAPRFSGFNQQDSSELLSFLLDGIHEDLNRVTTKPYIEAIEANDNDCESVAEKIWSNHKLRHDSIIVDNFQGLLKSRIVCPLCNHVSITFDPYMFLSIPLPTAQERIITFKMLYNNHDRPITEYGVRVTQAGSLSDLISAISEITRVQENRMIIGEIYTRKVFKFFNDKDLIGDIQTKDNIWVWEMPYQVDFENEFPLECRFFNNDGCYSANQIDFYLPITIPKDARRVDLFDLKSRFFAVASSWMIPYDSSDPAYHINAKSSQNQLTFYDLRYDNDTVDLSRANTLGIIFRKDLMNYERINAVSIDSSVPNETPGRSIQDEKILHLADCIDAYTMKETLSQENAWYCGKCKEFTCASKKFDIWSAPKILIFHLKRFLYSNLFRDKLGNFVEFPLEGLDMSNRIVGPHGKESLIYDLYAVSNHMGGLGGGHYTAYIKSFKDGKWYEANDSFTTAIPDPNSIKSASAYVLFYRQRSAETRLNEDERFEFVEHAESQVVVPDAVDREDEDREFEMNQVQGDDFDSLYDFLS